MILSIRNLSAGYGKNKVINGLNLDVKAGEIVMLVGANGTGKSTLLKSIFGLTSNISGEIYFEGKRVNPNIFDMISCGISFVPQNFRVFTDLTVEENIKIGAISLRSNFIDKKFDEVIDLFPKIKHKLKLKSSYLSGGERQIVALARSLMFEPKLLLLDEPSIGLAPNIVAEIFDQIKLINKNLGTTIIIVEHNLKSLLNIADRACILSIGKIVKEGKPQELLYSNILHDVFFGRLA